MGVTGKYDFRGLKVMGARGLLLALGTTPWGAWLIKFGFDKFLVAFFEAITNWLANQGLVVLNLGAIYVEGHFDQKAFDAAIENGLEQVELKKGKLTPQELKALDEAVVQAARRFLVFTK